VNSKSEDEDKREEDEGCPGANLQDLCELILVHFSTPYRKSLK